MNANSEMQEEKPLDPATENVRRKLVRFGGIFMGINMLALIAVLAALVYKIGGFGEDKAPAGIPAMSAPVLDDFAGEIDIPDGARITGASLNGGLLLVTLGLANGAQELWLYDLASRRVAGRISIR